MALSVSVWGAGLCYATAAQGATLYLCPGNLFTNQLDAVRARSQGCREASTAGLSQAVLTVAPARSAAEPGLATPPLAVVPQRQRAPVAAVASPTAGSRSGGEPSTGGRTTPPRSVDAALQRERDQDAQAILQTELARTLAAQQALASAAAGGTADNAAMQRLRTDEAALRRELARQLP